MQGLHILACHLGRSAHPCVAARVPGARFAVPTRRRGSPLTTASSQTVGKDTGTPGTTARAAPSMALGTSGSPTMEDFPISGILPHSLTAIPCSLAGTATTTDKLRKRNPTTDKVRKRNPTMVLQGRLRKNPLAAKDIHRRGPRIRHRPMLRLARALPLQPTAWIIQR